MDEYEISFANRLALVPRAEWEALCPPGANPLLSWGFLALLEASGSICPATGWQPAHVLVRSGAGGRLVAAAPFYAHGQAWGEFIFDWELEEAARAAGSAWYPKLVGMVPATPAPAWRVLVAPDQDEAALETLVLQAAGQAARRAGLAGLHIQWPAAGLAARLAGAGDGAGATGVAAWARWDHQVFLWEDRGYGDFDGLLAAFSKNMRRNVQRERAAVRAAGLEMRWLSAAEAAGQPGLLAEVADLYRAHNDRFGPYAARFLEPDFFLRLPEFMPGGWALGTAWRGGRLLAMSFFLEGGGRLYGRYYGAREDLPGLHFELCYYLPLEYALRAGIGSFDPGLGSPHKVRRGFRPRLAPSFHLAFDQSLQAAARPAFAAANRQAERAVAALAAELPYKATSGGQRPDRPD